MTSKLVNLKDGNEILVPKVIPRFDTANLIASGTLPYTATEDCIVTVYNRSDINNAYHGISIDGTIILKSFYDGYNNSGTAVHSYIPLIAGQIINSVSANSNGHCTSYKAYGIKY